MKENIKLLFHLFIILLVAYCCYLFIIGEFPKNFDEFVMLVKVWCNCI